MEIGIGLPSTIPGTPGRLVVEWAQRAEQHGFSTLGTIDRLVYPNYEPLIALAAAAAVTERIRLTTAILISPLHSNNALLAKQALSIDNLSGGRLVLGMALGGREDDYQASGLETKGRGQKLSQQLDELKRIWAGEPRGFAGPIGPSPVRPGGPELILGGHNPAAIARTVRYGDGWMSGGGGPEAFKNGADSVRAAWSAAGRDGSPRLLALAYYALGPDAKEHAGRYLKDYYGFLGPFAERIAEGALISLELARGAAGAFEAAGCDELILFPCAAELEQVDLLAQAVR